MTRQAALTFTTLLCILPFCSRNLVTFDSRVQVFVNVGPRTAPETFVFRHNVWYDIDGSRRPTLPVAEEDGVYLSNVGAGAYQRVPQVEDVIGSMKPF